VCMFVRVWYVCVCVCVCLCGVCKHFGMANIKKNLTSKIKLLLPYTIPPAELQNKVLRKYEVVKYFHQLWQRIMAVDFVRWKTNLFDKWFITGTFPHPQFMFLKFRNSG